MKEIRMNYDEFVDLQEFAKIGHQIIDLEVRERAVDLKKSKIELDEKERNELNDFRLIKLKLKCERTHLDYEKTEIEKAKGKIKIVEKSISPTWLPWSEYYSEYVNISDVEKKGLLYEKLCKKLNSIFLFKIIKRIYKIDLSVQEMKR